MIDRIANEGAAPLPAAVEGKLREHIAESSIELPHLPETNRRILELPTDDESYDPAAMSRVIESDPSLSAQIMRVANSVFYAPRAPIVSLHQAVTRLGATRVREILLLVSARGRVFQIPGREQEVTTLFRRSVAAGWFARELARTKRLPVDEAFLGGLLHDVARPVLIVEAMEVAEELGETAEWDAAMAFCDEQSPEVGGRLVRAWQLSSRLAEAIRHQKKPSDAPDEARLLAAFVAAGALMAATWMAEGSEALHGLGGHAAFEILEIYPDDLEQAASSADGLRDFLETI